MLLIKPHKSSSASGQTPPPPHFVVTFYFFVLQKSCFSLMVRPLAPSHSLLVAGPMAEELFLRLPLAVYSGIIRFSAVLTQNILFTLDIINMRFLLSTLKNLLIYRGRGWFFGAQSCQSPGSFSNIYYLVNHCKNELSLMLHAI